MGDLSCICDLDPIEYMQGQENHQNVEKQAFNIVHTQTLSLEGTRKIHSGTNSRSNGFFLVLSLHFLLHYKIIHSESKKIFAHFEHVAYNRFKCYKYADIFLFF